MNLVNEIQEKCRLLDNSIKMLRKTGKDYAKAYLTKITKILELLEKIK